MARVRRFGTEISGNRRRNAELSPEARAGIISSVKAGRTQASVAEEYHCHRNTISKTLKRFQIHHTLKSLPRKGRPRLSDRIRRHIITLSRRFPRSKYKDLVNWSTSGCSKTTIRRILREVHLRKWRSAKRLLLTKDDVRKRLAFARKYKGREEELVAALFSDECTIKNKDSHPEEWVIRLSTERYRPDFVRTVHSVKPPISIMVWAMIWLRDEPGKSRLIFVEGDPDAPRGGVSSRSYIDVLEEGMLPLYEQGDLFMQDNAPIHTSKRTKRWMRRHNIRLLEWPPHSPDLNPIEHIWRALKRQINRIAPDFQYYKNNIADIEAAKDLILSAWEALDDDLIEKLMNSMKKRLAAVRRARGWYTKY